VTVEKVRIDTVQRRLATAARAAAEKLVAERLLLAEDVDTTVATAIAGYRDAVAG
jgi:hypothetical protein